MPPPPVLAARQPARMEAPVTPPATTAVDDESAAVAGLEMLRLKSHYAGQLALAAAERDNAVAEAATLRKEAAGHRDQIALERRVAAEFSKRFSLCHKELGEMGQARDAMQAERDALAARVAELSAVAPVSAENAVALESTAWESRVTAQLEADIQLYRERIRTLLAESAALREERDRLAAPTAGASVAA